MENLPESISKFLNRDYEENIVGDEAFLKEELDEIERNSLEEYEMCQWFIDHKKGNG